MNRPHGQFTLQCGHDPALAQIVDDDSIGAYGPGDYDAWCYVCEAWVQAARFPRTDRNLELRTLI